MAGASSPLLDPNSYDREGLATGTLAGACLQAWATVSAARAYARAGDLGGLMKVIQIAQVRIPSWPPGVQAYVSNSIVGVVNATLPQPVEVA